MCRGDAWRVRGRWSQKHDACLVSEARVLATGAFNERDKVKPPTGLLSAVPQPADRELERRRVRILWGQVGGTVACRLRPRASEPQAQP